MSQLLPTPQKEEAAAVPVGGSLIRENGENLVMEDGENWVTEDQ